MGAGDRERDARDSALHGRQTVDAVHEVVDVGQDGDVDERQGQRQQQRQLAFLNAREGEDSRAEKMGQQTRNGRQRTQVVEK